MIFLSSQTDPTPEDKKIVTEVKKTVEKESLKAGREGVKDAKEKVAKEEEERN